MRRFYCSVPIPLFPPFCCFSLPVLQKGLKLQCTMLQHLNVVYIQSCLCCKWAFMTSYFVFFYIWPLAGVYRPLSQASSLASILICQLKESMRPSQNRFCVDIPNLQTCTLLFEVKSKEANTIYIRLRNTNIWQRVI